MGATGSMALTAETVKTVSLAVMAKSAPKVETV
jgi:hypothetical protein